MLPATYEACADPAAVLDLHAALLARGEAVDPDRPLSEIDAVVSSVRVLPPSLYTLARRVADRAAGSASDILRLVIPKRQVRVEKAWVARRDAEAQAVSGPPADADAADDAAAAAGSSSSAPGIEWARAVLETYPALTAALPPRGRTISVGTTSGGATRRSARRTSTRWRPTASNSTATVRPAPASGSTLPSTEAGDPPSLAQAANRHVQVLFADALVATHRPAAATRQPEQRVQRRAVPLRR